MGRPKSKEEIKSKKISIRLKPSTYKNLMAYETKYKLKGLSNVIEFILSKNTKL